MVTLNDAPYHYAVNYSAKIPDELFFPLLSHSQFYNNDKTFKIDKTLNYDYNGLILISPAFL